MGPHIPCMAVVGPAQSMHGPEGPGGACVAAPHMTIQPVRQDEVYAVHATYPCQASWPAIIQGSRHRGDGAAREHVQQVIVYGVSASKWGSKAAGRAVRCVESVSSTSQHPSLHLALIPINHSRAMLRLQHETHLSGWRRRPQNQSPGLQARRAARPAA